ncbi:MAG: hypothetical protein ACOYN4_21010, partial [Bacteroidales bacterium]
FSHPQISTSSHFHTSTSLSASHPQIFKSLHHHIIALAHYTIILKNPYFCALYKIKHLCFVLTLVEN